MAKHVMSATARGSFLVMAALLLAQPVLALAGTRPGPSSATCRSADGYAAGFGGRRTFLFKPDILERLKMGIEDDPATLAAYKALLGKADRALGRGPYTVTDKRMVPPSGDRHDYLSLAPYWWPDPSKQDGLPFIRRDGEINPDRATDKYDVTDLQAMSSDVETLALAFYFSNDGRYAAHAAKLLRVWFLAPATRMNPNMNFAQSVPGRETGRAEGIIDTARLQRVVDAIGLIAPSGALSATEQAGLETWFADYVAWMQKSPHGREEDAAKNNHGIWYDAQLMQFALFARKPDIAREVAEAFAERRLVQQISQAGSLPRELTRTRSFHYTIFALQPAFDVADLGACLGVDLWNFSDTDGRGLKKATDFIAAYEGRIEAWPYKELRPDPRELDDLLARAALAWPGAGFAVDAKAAAIRRYLKSEPEKTS